MEPFLSDGFLKMFSDAEKFKGHMKVVAQAYMDQLPSSEQAVSGLANQCHKELVPAMEKLEENLARIRGIMKCLNTAWVLGVDMGSPTCPDDVLSLANSKLKLQPELTLKELVLSKAGISKHTVFFNWVFMIMF